MTFQRDDRVIDNEGDLATVQDVYEKNVAVSYDNTDIGTMILPIEFFTLLTRADRAMSLREYSDQAGMYACYPFRGDSLRYTAYGLAGEVGELLGKLAKLVQIGQLEATGEDIDALSAELGDVLWFVSEFAHNLGTDLETIARKNLEKLEGRKARGTIVGNGDNR